MGVVAGTASRLADPALEAAFVYVEPVDESFYKAYRIVLAGVVVDALGQKQFLLSGFSFDVSDDWLVKSMLRI